jgi:hypothetical protein
MGIVHGLQRDTGIIAVKVAILDKVFDGIDNLDTKLLATSIAPSLTAKRQPSSTR